MFRFASASRTAAAAAVAAVAISPMLYNMYSARCAAEVAPGLSAPAFDPANFKSFKLVKTEVISHDTKKYTFEFPSPSDRSGLTVASIVLLKAPGPDGKPVIRPYTPTSMVDQLGSFDLIVKKYPTGIAGNYLDALTPGSSAEFKGPFVKFNYVPNQWDAVGMIAGGSGITPMYQLIRQILANPRDNTQIRLIYANRTPGDILLKKELDALAIVHKNFKVLYAVDSIPEDQKALGYEGATGHVSKDMIASFLPPPQPEAGKHKVLVCGPPGMMKFLSGEKKSPTDQGDLTGLLADLSYTKDTVFKY